MYAVMPLEIKNLKNVILSPKKEKQQQNIDVKEFSSKDLPAIIKINKIILSQLPFYFPNICYVRKLVKK